MSKNSGLYPKIEIDNRRECLNLRRNLYKAYEAHEWLERFYSHILFYSKEGKQAKEYLKSRGINDETIQTFRIGFSPLKSDVTFEFLKRKGFNYTELVDANILRRLNSGRLSNILRNRIVFPIRDYKGRTVAFGGRSLDPSNKIKYINSEESVIFKKHKNLFGFNQARKEMERQGYGVLMEGYFDVLKAHQNGVKNAVASLGTALTINQALLLKSITENIVIAYDGDEAGVENSFKSAAVLDNVGSNVRIALMEGDRDPDEYISVYGGDAFIGEIINKAKDVKLTLIDYKKQNYDLSKATDRYDYAEEVLNGIVKSSNQDNREPFKKLEDVMDLSFRLMEEEIMTHSWKQDKY